MLIGIQWSEKQFGWIHYMSASSIWEYEGQNTSNASFFCWSNFKVRYDETVDLPNTVWFHMSAAKCATGANISANIKEMKHYNKNKIRRKLFWYNFKPRIYATRCLCWFFLSVNLHGRIAKREAKRVNLILIWCYQCIITLMVKTERKTTSFT